MERGWSLAVQKGSNHVALGYDEGCVLIQLGREEPAMSMDGMGKILWAKHAEIQQVWSGLWLSKKWKKDTKLDREINKTGYTGQDGAPASLILRPIPRSIRPFPNSIDLTVDEYYNEWNDE